MTEIDNVKHLLQIIASASVITENDNSVFKNLSYDTSKILIKKKEIPLNKLSSDRKITHYELDIISNDLDSLLNEIQEGFKKFNWREDLTKKLVIGAGESRYGVCSSYFVYTDLTADTYEYVVNDNNNFGFKLSGLLRFESNETIEELLTDVTPDDVELRIFPHGNTANPDLDLYGIDNDNVSDLSVRTYTKTTAKVDITSAMTDKVAYDIDVSSIITEIRNRSGYEEEYFGFLFQEILDNSTQFYSHDSDETNSSEYYPEMRYTWSPFLPDGMIWSKILRTTSKFNKKTQKYKSKMLVEIETSIN